MPRDPRLYMTFPIDFDEHPKVEPLSDAAFRTFVSMNGYSRRQRLDGRIPAVVARKRWRAKDLAELLASHDERPLVLLEGDVYVLRDYAEHQFTTADEKKLHDDKARAGAAGGRAKARAVAGAKQQPQQNVARSEIGIETQDDVTYLPRVSTDPTVRESGISPELALLVEEKEFIRAEADKLGLRDVPNARRMLEGVVGPLPADDSYVLELVRAIVVLALAPVTNADAYVRTTCKNSPAEVQAQWATVQINSPMGAVA